MAYDNDFSYNDAENVKRESLPEYEPVFTVNGRFSVYKHKSAGRFYITPAHNAGIPFSDTDRSVNFIRMRYRALLNGYLKGIVYFSSLAIKADFLTFFSID